MVENLVDYFTITFSEVLELAGIGLATIKATMSILPTYSKSGTLDILMCAYTIEINLIRKCHVSENKHYGKTLHHNSWTSPRGPFSEKV